MLIIWKSYVLKRCVLSRVLIAFSNLGLSKLSFFLMTSTSLLIDLTYVNANFGMANLMKQDLQKCLTSKSLDFFLFFTVFKSNSKSTIGLK